MVDRRVWTWLFLCLLFPVSFGWAAEEKPEDSNPPAGELADSIRNCSDVEGSAKGLCKFHRFWKFLGDNSVWNIQNVLKVEWHHNHTFDAALDSARILPDDFVKLRDILTVDYRLKEFLLGMRAEAQYYPDTLVARIKPPAGRYSIAPIPAPVLLYNPVSTNDFNVEKFYGVYDTKLLRVDAGDYYVTFGRGLALAMRKDGEDVLDNTLRGMKFELNAGNSSVKALAGLSNTINIDPNHEGQQQDPGDMIAGLRFEQRIAELFSLGAHGVYADFGALESDWRKRFIPEKQTEIFGGSIDFPDIGGVVSLYGEGNYLRRTGRRLTELGDDFEIVEDDGYGVYGSISTYIENFTLHGEYKLYKDFAFRRGHAKIGYNNLPAERVPDDLEFFEDIYYNNVPTLEREDIEINRDFINDHGFRVRADYNFEKTGTEPYAAFYFTLNEHAATGSTSLGGFGSSGNLQGDRIWHVYAGLTQYIKNAELVFDAGYRDEIDSDTKQELAETLHAKISASVPVLARHVLNGEVFYIRKDDQLFLQMEQDFDVTLGYTFRRAFALSFLYTLQHFDYLPDQGEDATEHYFAGEIRSLFSDMIELSVFGGQVRGSYRCYGGFCRKIPPFEGVKGRITLRF